MRDKILLAIFVTVLIGCNADKTNEVVKIAPEFKSDFPLDTSIHFQNVRHVAYAYRFAYPIDFIDIIDTIGQSDSSIYYSKSKDAKLKYFIEGNVSSNDTSKNFLYEYYNDIETRKHPFVKNCKTLKSQYCGNNSIYYNRGYFVILGQVDSSEFIWKTELSEVPVSGDLTFKTVFFIYPIKKQKEYQPIGVRLANGFGDPLEQSYR